LNLEFDEKRLTASRHKGSTDATCFCEKRVDYYEVEILELYSKGQTRTAAFGYLWDLPTIKLQRAGKNASELKCSVVFGGELPQVRRVRIVHNDHEAFLFHFQL